MYIDAIGKLCPMPVILAKKEIDAEAPEVTIAVDNETAVENLKRLAKKSGYCVSVENSGDNFVVTMGRDDLVQKASAPVKTNKCAENYNCSGSGYAVFIGKDYVGDGDITLGQNLMKMALYTLSQSADVPSAVLFMNSGVKLPCSDEQQIIDSINTLKEKGAKILVCGTCLNYFSLADKLKTGAISNMYDILSCMQDAHKVITL